MTSFGLGYLRLPSYTMVHGSRPSQVLSLGSRTVKTTHFHERYIAHLALKGLNYIIILNYTLFSTISNKWGTWGTISFQLIMDRFSFQQTLKNRNGFGLKEPGEWSVNPITYKFMKIISRFDQNSPFQLFSVVLGFQFVVIHKATIFTFLYVKLR